MLDQQASIKPAERPGLLHIDQKGETDRMRRLIISFLHMQKGIMPRKCGMKVHLIKTTMEFLLQWSAVYDVANSDIIFLTFPIPLIHDSKCGDRK